MTRRLVPILFCALSACRPAAEVVAPAPPPNILLITVDTMRADRLGRGFTPSLDQLAAQGLRFTEARSVVPLTLPAHASIMTGQFRRAWHPHQWRRATGGYADSRDVTESRRHQTRAVVAAFVLDAVWTRAGLDDYDDQIARILTRWTVAGRAAR